MKLVSLFWHWCLYAVTVSLVFGVLYIAMQQFIRQSANDPQIALLQESLITPAVDGKPQILSMPVNPHVAIEKSLLPFMTIFDATGAPVQSTGFLHDQMPTLPAGVFEYARREGQERFTWQPERGVREAVVISAYTAGNQSGFVMAARSLREVEKRSAHLLLEVFFGWFVTLLIGTVLLFLPAFALKFYSK